MLCDNPEKQMRMPDPSYPTNIHRFLFRHLGCEYKLETNSGSFGANNYPAYQYCSWSITVKHGLEVFLKFTTLNIPDCSENQLEVYDGVDNTGSLLAVYCAKNATSGNTVRSTGNNMYVMFKSGNDNSGSLQFQAQYEAKEPITGNKHKRNFLCRFGCFHLISQSQRQSHQNCSSLSLRAELGITTK